MRDPAGVALVREEDTGVLTSALLFAAVKETCSWFTNNYEQARK